jgi:hypothetical protein
MVLACACVVLHLPRIFVAMAYLTGEHMPPDDDSMFQEALDRSAKVVSGLPELLQPSAFSVVFPLIYTPGSKRGMPKRPRRTASHRAAATSAPNRLVGPKGAIDTLRAEGFFAVPRTVEELATAIKDSRGQAFEGRMLSTALLRMLRGGVLERSRTSAGDYAYMETK